MSEHWHGPHTEGTQLNLMSGWQLPLACFQVWVCRPGMSPPPQPVFVQADRRNLHPSLKPAGSRTVSRLLPKPLPGGRSSNGLLPDGRGLFGSSCALMNSPQIRFLTAEVSTLRVLLACSLSLPPPPTSGAHLPDAPCSGCGLSPDLGEEDPGGE